MFPLPRGRADARPATTCLGFFGVRPGAPCRSVPLPRVRARFGLRLCCVSAHCPEAADLLFPSSSGQLPLLQQLIAVAVGPTESRLVPIRLGLYMCIGFLALFGRLANINSCLDLFGYMG